MGSFIKEVESPVLIQAGNAPFDLPTTSAVANLGSVVPLCLRSAPLRIVPMIDGRFDTALAQGSSEGVAVIALVGPDALRTSPSFADHQGIDRGEGHPAVVDIGLGRESHEREATPIDQNTPF